MRINRPTESWLSKSDFKIARKCPTQLYYRKRGYPSRTDQDGFAQMLAEEGYIVETIAKLLYPGRVEIGYQCGVEQAAHETLRALSLDHVTLSQATVVSGNKLARIDLLKKVGDEFQLIEVKAKAFDSRDCDYLKDGKCKAFWSKDGHSISSVWRPELEDITFQVMVLHECFPKAKINPYLMMPDKGKPTAIENFHSHFVVSRTEQLDSNSRQILVEFTGDIQTLRREHFLTKVSVDREVTALLPEVQEAAHEHVANLFPRLRRIVKLPNHRGGRSTQPSLPL